MDLLILKKSLGPGAGAVASYRGTERGQPIHFANLPDSHVANRLFFWFVEEGGARGVVHDLKRAKQLVELLNLFGNSVFYEIVQVGTGREPTPGKGGFLGFDVSAASNPSLLRRFVMNEHGAGLSHSTAADDVAICDLSQLHRQFFLPKLNDHRLFNSYDDAEFCLRTARALNACKPGWIEGTDLSEYGVVSVHKVL